MEAEIADLMDAIQKLQDIINSDEEKIRIVGAVQGHVSNMKVGNYLSSLLTLSPLCANCTFQTEVHDLNDVLTPAITTLGKLKGAWTTMGTMLQALNDAFSKENNEIDYPSIAKNELEKIRRKWNDLREYSK